MKLTVVIVYQNSMPWLEMCLESWKHFRNDAMPEVQFIFVENLPQYDSGEGTAVVNAFMSEFKNCRKISRYTAGNQGSAHHEGGLNEAFPLVDTEWCMFMDPDTIPVTDHWLDQLFELGADMVGPQPDSGLAASSFSRPILHPCLLLFRTKLVKPPYWNMFFGRWNRLQTDDGSDWDVCRPFTYHVGIRPDVKQVKLHNNSVRVSNTTACFLISKDGTNAFAVHMREGSRTLIRHKFDDRHMWAKTFPLFSWYTKEISPCVYG